MLLSELVTPAPWTIELPPLVRPKHVGGDAAWHSLVRAGALNVLDLDAATIAGVKITPSLRAAALAPYVAANSYIVGPSAAWVHCGGQPPNRLHLGHQLGTNQPNRPVATEVWSSSGLWAESYYLGIDEDRARVTTPVRTAVDLALREDPEEARRLIRALAAHGLDLVAAAKLLEFRGRSRSRPGARKVFAELMRELAVSTGD